MTRFERTTYCGGSLETTTKVHDIHTSPISHQSEVIHGWRGTNIFTNIFTFWNEENNERIVMKKWKFELRNCFNLCGIMLIPLWHNHWSRRYTWDRKPFRHVRNKLIKTLVWGYFARYTFRTYTIDCCTQQRQFK